MTHLTTPEASSSVTCIVEAGLFAYVSQKAEFIGDASDLSAATVDDLIFCATAFIGRGYLVALLSDHAFSCDTNPITPLLAFCAPVVTRRGSIQCARATTSAE